MEKNNQIVIMIHTAGKEEKLDSNIIVRYNSEKREVVNRLAKKKGFKNSSHLIRRFLDEFIEKYEKTEEHIMEQLIYLLREIHRRKTTEYPSAETVAKWRDMVKNPKELVELCRYYGVVWNEKLELYVCE